MITTIPILKGEEITLDKLIVDERLSKYYRLLLLNSRCNKKEALLILQQCNSYLTDAIVQDAVTLFNNGFAVLSMLQFFHALHKED